MPGAERTMEVDAPASVLFDIITDYESYPEFLNDMGPVTVHRRGDDYDEVEFTLNLLKKVHYTIKLTSEKDKWVSWTMVRSNLLKANNGGWTLEPLSDERTRVTYRLEIGVGRFVPARVLDKMAGSTLPATMDAFKARAEKRYRDA